MLDYFVGVYHNLYFFFFISFVFTVSHLPTYLSLHFLVPLVFSTQFKQVSPLLPLPPRFPSLCLPLCLLPFPQSCLCSLFPLGVCGENISCADAEALSFSRRVYLSNESSSCILFTVFCLLIVVYWLECVCRNPLFVDVCFLVRIWEACL